MKNNYFPNKKFSEENGIVVYFAYLSICLNRRQQILSSA